ncbi:hypothetical protein [Micromonospora chersina]|uniref:hypothetical protein n=1 Tax=Micromonospora chersina TaxID=47854 RepID=UPI0033C71F9B
METPVDRDLTVLSGEAAYLIGKLLPRPPEGGWETLQRLILSSLSFGHLQAPAVIGANALSVLRLLANGLSAEARQAHLRVMASVAERARRLRSLHAACQGDPSTILRSSQRCFDVLVTAEEGRRKYEAAESLAFYALGRWTHERHLQHHSSVVLRSGISAQRRSGLEMRVFHRWPSHIRACRRRDLSRLLAGHPSLVDLHDTLVESSVGTPSDLKALTDLHARLNVNTASCYCFTDPSAVFESLFGDHIRVPWVALSLNTESESFLRLVEAAAYPRRDLFRLENEALVLEPEGLAGSFMVATLNYVGDATASTWQESEVTREARKMTGGLAKVWANVAWSKSSDDLTVHGGEVDCMTILDGVLFDFQAKAPTSLDYRQRESLVCTSALRQHESLHRELRDGVFLIRRKHRTPSLLQSGAIRTAPNGLMHLPVTVGVEPVHEFSVGGSNSNGGIGRVLTTLDHIRLVNAVVPAPFGAVYWLDRYCIESNDLRFVDEVDFLGRWYALLCGEDQVLDASEALDASSVYVMADFNRIEEYLAAVNAFSGRQLRSDKSVQEWLRKARGDVRRGEPTSVAPKFTGALMSLARRNVRGWLSLAASVVDVNLASLERRFVAKSDLSLTREQVSFAIQWNVSTEQLDQHVSNGLPSEADLVMHWSGGRWNLWQSPGWPSRFRQALSSGAFSRFKRFSETQAQKPGAFGHP